MEIVFLLNLAVFISCYATIRGSPINAGNKNEKTVVDKVEKNDEVTTWSDKDEQSLDEILKMPIPEKLLSKKEKEKLKTCANLVKDMTTHSLTEKIQCGKFLVTKSTTLKTLSLLEGTRDPIEASIRLTRYFINELLTKIEEIYKIFKKAAGEMLHVVLPEILKKNWYKMRPIKGN